jgi:F-type H+-transporting ATPase subunit b
MDLQWKAALTQALGFGIVVWLLHKYAWKAVLEFVEKRRETIAAEFDNIEQAKAEADALKVQLEKELDQIETTRRAKIQEAVSEANDIAAEMKEQARVDALDLRNKTSKDIEMELDKANTTLRDRMVAAVVTTSEKVIKERLDSDKHRELIESFLKDVDLKEETN